MNPHVDSLSVITYLAQFSEAKLVEGAPIKEGGDPAKVKADGEGLKSEGLFASEEPVEFTVDVSEAKPFGSLRVSITDPHNLEIRPEVKFSNDIYTYQYSPVESGAYTISINWWGKPITRSPFLVNVGRKMALSPRHSTSISTRSSLSSVVSVYGSGVEGENLRACEPAGFWVEGVPSNSTLQIKVVGPQGQLGSDYVTIQGVAKGYYYVLYYPLISGTYKITTCISGKDVAQSPYTVSVGEKSSLVQGWARGPGVDGTNIEVSSKTWFNVFVPTGSSRDVIVEIEGPKGKVTATQEKAIMSVFRYTYVPKHQGRYKITVIIGPRGRAITLYFIVIAPSSVTKGSFKVWGKGISPRGVQARQKAEVYFQPIAADQEVAFDIKSEDGEQVPFSESTENGISTFTYIPPAIGCYIITFLSNGEPVHSTPFKVNVTDVSKIILTGENIDGSAVPLKKKLVYNVDARKAGYGQLACQVVSVNANRVASLSPKVLQKKDSTYEVNVQPIVVCEEELLFTYDDALLTQNPIRINAVDVSQIKVYGRGIQKGNVAMKSTSFTVDLNKAGSGKLVAVITGPVDPTVNVTPTSENYIFNCEYTPTEPGEYSATVTFSGIETNGSQYKFQVLPAGDKKASSGIAMYGPAVEGPLTVGTRGEFFIALGPESMKSANVSVKGPEGEEKVKQEPIKENEVVQYSFPVYQPGPYFISADFNGTPVEGSPFETKSEFPENLPKVSVSGKGLREAFVNEWAEFEIDSQREGSGSLDVTVNGPSGAETKMEGKGKGKAAVKYQPTSTGEHQINVLFNNQAIPGSPFPIAVQSKETRTQVVKLEPTGVSLGSDFTYSIDTSKAAKPVSLTGKVLGPFTKGSVPEALKSKAITVKSFSKVAGNLVVTKPKVSEKNKVYTVAFTPSKVGVYLIYVFFGDRLVDKMPYEVYVCDPTKIKVKGPGLGKNKNENSHINKPLTWEADCAQAGPGTFTAYVGGPDDCTKDVSVNLASSPDQYSISYTPNVPGGYQLLFAYSGFQLSDKPTVMISDPSKAQLGDKGGRVCLVNEKVSFPLDLSAAGAGKLQASLDGPVEVPIEYAKGPNSTCTFSFTPTDVGKYSLNVSFGNKPLSDKPLEVTAINPSRVSVYGPGVTGLGAKVNESAPVYVDLSESGAAPVNVTLETPNKEVIPLELVPNSKDESIYETAYVPSSIGYHKLSIDYAGKPIEGSPFKVPIADPSLITYSEFNMPLYAVPGESVKLDFMTESAGPGELTAQFQPIDGKGEPSNATVKMLPDKPGHYEVAFPVSDQETYRGTVCYNDVPVCSPITISGSKPTECDVEGPGVRRKVAVGRRTHFTVKPKNKIPKEPLSVVITSPDYSPVSVTVNDAVTPYEVQYTPTVTGEHLINIGFGQSPVSKSPYKTKAVDVSRLQLTPSTKSYRPGDTVEFVADVSTANDGAYNIDVQGPEECPVTSEDTSGKRAFSFRPKKPGVYSLMPTYDELPVSEDPLWILVADKDSIGVSGSGVTGVGVGPGQKAVIDVDLSKITGVDLVDLNGSLQTPSGDTDSLTFNEINPGVYTTDYVPKQPGEYTVDLTVHDIPIADSPYTVPILAEGAIIAEPQIAVMETNTELFAGLNMPLESRPNLYGPAVEGPLTVGTPGEFFIALGPESMKSANVSVKGPEGEEKVKQEPIKENEVVQYSFPVYQPGPYFISADFNGTPVEGSPFEIKSEFPENLPKVSVSGKGLREAFVNEWAEFEIDSQREGSGSLDVTVNGPSGAEIKMEGKGKGKAAVKYQPTSTGEHQINVLFNNQAIPGSPFSIAVQSKEARTQVVKLEPTGVSLGSDFTYSIDTSKAAKPVSLTGKVLGPFTKGSVPEALKSKEITVKSFSKVAGKLMVTKPKVSEKNKVYTVAFTPSKVGVYLIYVFFGDQLVDKMPYEVYVCDPTKIKVKGPGLGKNKNENSHINKPLTWEADCAQAGPGTFTAYVGGPDDCTKDVSVNPASSPDQYSISYTPNVPGGYQLLFAYSGFQLSDKPTVMISDPSKAQLGDKGGRVCLVNEKVSFPLDLSAAGAGKLQASLEGPVEIPIEYAKGPNNTCTFSFTPTDVGKYSLNVSFGNKPLSDKPLEVTAINPSRVSVYGPGVTGLGAKVNESAPVYVDLSESGAASVNVTLETPNKEVIPLELVPNSKDESIYETAYVPSSIGYHKLSIDYAGKPIEGSPFKVPIADPSLITYSEFNMPLYAVPGESVKLDFMTENAGPGELTAQFQPIDGKGEPSNATVKTLPDKPGHYEVAFPVSDQETYRGTVCYNDVPVCSPITISGSKPILAEGAVIAEPQMAVMETNTELFAGNPLLNMPDGIQSIGTVSGPAIEQDKLQAGNDTYITVDISDAGATDAPIVTLKNPEMDAIQTSTSQKSPGVYNVSFTPVQGGNHQLDVKACGQPVSESPYTLQVFNPSAVQCINDGPVRVVPGTPVNLEYDISNAGPGSFKLDLNGPEESTIVPSTNEENPNLLSFTFTPKTPGVYEAHATFEGVPISEKPLKVKALKEITPNDIKLEGDAVTEAALNMDNEFDLTLPGIVTEEVSMVWQGPDHSALPLDFLIEPLDADHCRVKYKPKEEGTFEANLTYAGNPLFDEPWNVTVADVSKATVSGPAIEGDRKLQAGKETYVTVNTTEARAVKPKVKVSGPNNEEIPTETTVKAPGIVDVTFTPVQGGNHQLDVKACGQPVSESPYTLQVFNPSAVQCITDGPVRVVPGTPVNLEYDISNAGPGSFKLDLNGPEESTIVPGTNEENPNLLSFTFTPNTQGVYEAQATFEGVPISEKPLKVKALKEIAPNDIKLEGDAVTEAALNMDNEFDLTLPGIVTEEVSMVWQGPDHSAIPLDFLIEPLDADHCRVKYKPKEEGTFEANLTYAGNPLFDEPWNVTVADVSKATVSGPAIEGDRKLQAGKETYVTVNTTEARAVKPKVKVSGPNNEEIPTETTVKARGIVDVTFTPVQGGNHQLDVKACGQPVSESPYTLQVFNPSAVQCINDGPVRVVPGTPVNLEYDISNAGPGSFKLDLNGPEESTIVPSTNEENPNLLSFTFTPNTQGVYEAQATFEGIPISEKPLKIKALKEITPNDIKLEGDAVTEAALNMDNEFDLTLPGIVTEEVSMVWQGPDHSAIPLDFLIEPLDADHCRVKYKPKEEGTFEANLTYAGNPLFDEPWNVTVADVNKATVSGPAIEGDRKLQAGKETYVTVNTTEARAVKPKVKVSGPNNEEIPTETTVKSPGIVDVTFTPVQGGNHQLDVKACGQPVSESPYTLQVFNPSAVQCINDGPVRVVPGTPVNLEYDISNAGPGSFKLDLNGPEESTIVPSTNEENPNLLSFTFTPNTQGVYEAQATFEGVPISEKPLKVKAINDVKLDEIKVEGDAISEAGVNTENVIDLFIPMVVPEEVSMEWRGPDHSELPFDFDVELIDKDHCRIKYKPVEEGSFEANLTYAGNPLYAEPLNITVGDANKATVSGPAIEGDRKLQAGKETYVTVNTTEARAVKPKVKVSGPNNEEIPTETTVKAPGIVDVTFTPVQGGNHQLDVKACGQPVSESPYTLQVFNPSAVQCITDGPVRVVPGTPVNLEYDISNAGPGSFKLDLNGPEESTIVPGTNEENPNLLSFTFTPNTQGVYEAQATFEGVPISEKPLKVKALKEIAPNDIKLEGDAVTEAALNMDNEFDLTLPGIVTEEVSMVWQGPDHSAIPLDFLIEPLDADHCHVKYKPKEEGTFEANLTYAGNPLFDEPWNVTVADVNKATVSGPAIEGDRKLQAGKETYVTVNTTEARAVKPKVKVSGPNNEEIPTETTVKSPGIVDVTFTPVKGGNHQLDVKACGQPVSESPYTLQVFNPSAVQCINDGPVRVVPGTPVNLEYDISNAGPGSFKLDLNGPEESTIVPSTNEENPNLLSFTFTPNTQGTYEAQATFEGVPISEKPLKVKAINDVKLDEIKVEGDAISEAGVNTENVIDLFIPMVVPEEVSMEWRGPDHSELPFDFDVELIDKDHCRIKYKPVEEGSFEANLTYAGNPLYAEPLNITVGDANKATVSGPAIEGDRKLQAGKETYVTINTTEARAVKPKVKVSGPNNEEIPTETTVKAPGIVDVTFTPVQGGNHQLDVKACGQPVSESPYTLQVFNPSAVQCINDGPVRVVPGTPVNLEYDISNAGPGSFKLDLNGPEESTIVPSTNEENPNLLSFTFTPKTPGVYEAHATFEAIPISEKPLNIFVTDTEMLVISGSGATGKKAQVGEPVEIVVDTSKSGPVPIVATLVQPSGEKEELIFTAKEDNPDLLMASYTPMVSGYYDLIFLVNGEEIYKEPLRPYVVNPAEFQVVKEEEIYPQQAVLGQVNSHEIFVENGVQEEDCFGVFLLTEDEADTVEEAIECNALKLDKDHVKIEYLPEVETAQFVVLTYNEVRISEKLSLAKFDTSECLMEDLKTSVPVNAETSFVVSGIQSNKYEVTGVVTQEDGNNLEAKVEKIESEEEGKFKYRISYTPVSIGFLTVIVKCGAISLCEPITVNVFDASLVTCTGLENVDVLVGVKVPFAVDTSKAGAGAELLVQLEGPEDSSVLCQSVSDCHYSGVLSSERSGACHLHVTYGGIEIPSSPFVCRYNRPEPDVTKCSVGDLQTTPGEFMIDCRDGGGNGILEVAVYGAFVPARSIAVEHNGDYTFNVNYDIPDPVETFISVKWHGIHLNGSPFKVKFDQ